MRRGEGHGDREHRTEDGQATVEFALTLPLVVLIAMLVVQIGLVAKDGLLVHHAAREAARAAAVEPDVAVARQAAVSGASLDPSRLTVSLQGGGAKGEPLTAVVTYQSETGVPLVGRLVPDVTLRGEVSMRTE